MLIRAECSNAECRRPYKLSLDLIGKSVWCKQCRQSFTVVALEDTSIGEGPGRKPDISPVIAGGSAPKRLGRFEVRERLGSGAFGVVYRAFDPQLEREVALKVPRAETLEKSGAVERFLREAKAAAQLHHPNIVAIYDAGRDGEQYYIASAFIAGRPMDTAVEAGPVEPPRAARIVQQLAEAINYAHGQGIIHRDIKPANVMLDEQDQPHLMDFGLARFDLAAAKLTHDGAVMGTPVYMSPEQASGQNDRAKEASDQYSLGILFYELLTGLTPFSGPVEVVLVNVLHTPPKPPRELNRNVPRDLETICLKTISKEPESRYVSCHALADDLKRWLQDEPITARRVSHLERLLRWCQRNPVIASLMTVTAILLVAVAGISTFAAWRLQELANRERQETERANQEKTNAQQERTKALNLARTNAALADQERSAREIAEQNLFASHMSLVRNAWEDSNGGRVVELLNRWQPTERPKDRASDSLSGRDGPQSAKDRRGFEWYYWNRLAHSYLLDLKGPSLAPTYSPDSKWLATSQLEGAFVDGVWKNTSTLIVWNAVTGQSRLTLEGQGNPFISTMAFSPDGNQLAFTEGPIHHSGDSSRPQNGPAEIKIWDLVSNEPLHVLKVPAQKAISIVFSPDGKQFAIGYYLDPSGRAGSECKIWDLTTSQERLTLRLPSYAIIGGTPVITANAVALTPNVHVRTVDNMGFTSDGQRILSFASDGSTTEWDAKSGEEIRTFQQPMSGYACFATSPDRTRFAIYTTDGIVKICDASTGDVIRSLNLPAARQVLLNANGTRLAAMSDRGIRLWDVHAGRQLFTLTGYTGTLSSIAFSPDGRRLASVSSDGSLKIWDATCEQESLKVVSPARYASGRVTLPLTNQASASARRQVVSVFDATTGNELAVLNGPGKASPSALDISGKRVATTGDSHSLQVSDAATRNVVLELKGHTAGISLVAFSPDGKKLATSSVDRTVIVWDGMTGGKIAIFRGHKGNVTAFAFSPNGARVASVGDGGRAVRLWDATSGTEIRNLQTQLPSQFFTDVTFHPEGSSLAVGDTKRQVHIWDTTSGQEALIQTGHAGNITSVAYSPDGIRLASASADQTIKLWDTVAHAETLTLKGKWDSRVDVAFSADGQRLAAMPQGGTPTIWDARPWTADLRLEQQALNLIRFLLGQLLTKEAVTATIYSDVAITTEVRTRAIQLLDKFDDNVEK